MTIIGATTGLKKAGGGAWTPASVSGLVSWFDASNAGSLTVDGSNNVSQWNDLSGNGISGSNSGTNRPVLNISAQNGLNTIRFTKANLQSLILNSSITAPAQHTFFGVMRSLGGTYLRVCTLSNTATDAAYPFMVYDTYGTYVSNSTNWAQTAVNETSTVYNQWTSKNSGGSTGFSVSKNNSALTLGTTNTLARPSTYTVIGRWVSDYMDGYIAEFFLYNSVLGATDTTAAQNYLKAKWATP